METLTTDTLCNLEKQGNKFALVKSDETQYWKGNISKRAGKVYGYYLVNLTEPTCLCSPEINFPAQCVYNRVKNYERFTDDELFEIELNGCGEDGFSYFSEYSAFDVVHTWNDERTEEEIIEYLRGNPME